MTLSRLEVATPTGPAWIDLDRPRSPRGLFVLGHGAGGGIQAPDLMAARDSAIELNLAVARVTQPYRVAGRRTPAPTPQLDAAWLAAVSALRRQRGMAQLPLAIGGRSSGARVACRTATACRAVAVVALAFPLHPPGRPERSRLEELTQPEVPVLLVQGDRDGFGLPPAEAVTRRVVIPGADHGLKRGLADVRAAVGQFLAEQIGDPAPEAERGRPAARSGGDGAMAGRRSV